MNAIDVPPREGMRATRSALRAPAIDLFRNTSTAKRRRGIRPSVGRIFFGRLVVRRASNELRLFLRRSGAPMRPTGSRGRLTANPRTKEPHETRKEGCVHHWWHVRHGARLGATFRARERYGLAAARPPEPGAALIEEIRAAGGQAHFIELATADQAGWDAAVSEERTNNMLTLPKTKEKIGSFFHRG